MSEEIIEPEAIKIALSPYRQEIVLKQDGTELSRKTIVNGMVRSEKIPKQVFQWLKKHNHTEV
jgi:ABC-type arginine/histidine transport system permease subunit